jgi:hypothetical protein
LGRPAARSPSALGGLERGGRLIVDQPALFGGPQMAIYTIDKQPFHLIAEGVPTFERLPQQS